MGFERAGLVCKWQVEIDPFASSILAKHWPGVERHDDIRTFTPSPVDVVCGAPCLDSPHGYWTGCEHYPPDIGQKIPDIVRQCLIEWMVQTVQEISEDTWAAGWYSGIEHLLWDAMHGKEITCLQWCSTKRALRKLKEVSGYLGVWVHWDKEAGEPRSIPVAVWVKIHEAKGGRIDD